MNPEWSWPAILMLAVPAALGHLYHFVLMINFGSGLGFPEPVMDRLRTCMFTALWATSAFLLWEARARAVVDLVGHVLELRPLVRTFVHDRWAVQFDENRLATPA